MTKIKFLSVCEMRTLALWEMVLLMQADVLLILIYFTFYLLNVDSASRFNIIVKIKNKVCRICTRCIGRDTGITITSFWRRTAMWSVK